MKDLELLTNIELKDLADEIIDRLINDKEIIEDNNNNIWSEGIMYYDREDYISDNYKNYKDFIEKEGN